MILGKKMKMSQIWKDEKVIPVTLIKVEPNTVSLVRTKEKDKYQAIQLKVLKTKKKTIQREFKTEGIEEKELPKKGDKIDVSIFSEGDKVKISGISKGRGFQGVVKRHGFHGGPKSHGQKDRLRAPGSIGATGPQHVFKGVKMAGRMGGERKTIKNLKVVGVDKEKNILILKGAVPGFKDTIVEIRKMTPKASS